MRPALMNSIALTNPVSAIRTTSIPTKVWTLALLCATSAASLGGSAAAPLSPGAPVRVPAICAALLMVAAVTLLAFSRRVGDRALLGVAGARLVIVVICAASARTAGGTFFAAAGIVWLSIWATAFYSVRLRLVALAAILVGVALAVALNPQHVRTAVDFTPIVAAGIILSGLLTHALRDLRREARNDHLTGLLNRYGLDEALRELSHGQGLRRPASLIAIDLDGFKAINDQKGHLAGDRMLITFATELMSAASRGDLVARMGGDEFIVILPDTSASVAEFWADALKSRTCLSWSYGVAQRDGDESLESWLSRADQLMYAAKSARRRQPSLHTRPLAHAQRISLHTV